MNTRVMAQTTPPVTADTPLRSNLLQRKCQCGGTPGPVGECEECRKKKRLTLQTKLLVNKPRDIHEQEVDRIADRVISAPARKAVTTAPPRIKRFSQQMAGQLDAAAPESVDRALASSGKPLQPALRQEMEQRFGHDFSNVRVHTDSTAARSAQEVNANAYTVGQNIVFGAGQFVPMTLSGRRLLSHELAHVVQQSGGGPSPGPAQERDAEAVSAAIDMGVRPRVQTSSGVGFAPQPRGGALAGPMEMDPTNRGLKIVTVEEVEAKVNRVLKAPGASVGKGKDDFNANPVAARASLYGTHFRDEHERLSYALGFFRTLLSIDGPPDPNELFHTLVAYQTQMEMQSADIVIHERPTETESHRLIQLRTQARARELAAEEARTLEQVRLIVEDYYTRGERLKPSVDATLLTIEEAAEAEKKGRTSRPYTMNLVPQFGFSYTEATFKYGQKKNRFTVVDPGSGWGGIIKVFDRYYYAVDSDTMFDRFFGVGAYAEDVWENTKHINVAYGHLVKGIGHIASLGNNPLGQMMAPMMETAGEGMLYEVRKIDARLAGEEFAEEAPEIGWRTVVQGFANVAGAKAGGFAGKVVGKFAPRAASVAGLAVGMETSTVITKSYEAASGNIEWSDVFRPDVSPVEMLVGLVEGAVLHKFGERWTKGRAPKVPKPERIPPATIGKESESTGEPVSKAKGAADVPDRPGEKPGKVAEKESKAGGYEESARTKEPAQTAEQTRTEEVVHVAAERAGSEVEMGGEKHGVAAYGQGEFGGFQLCSGQCGLLARKLAELERILPPASDLAHDVRFLKQRAEGYDAFYRKGPPKGISKQSFEESIKQAARNLAGELRKNVIKDPFIERLLDMSVEDLRKNRAALKKEAAASPILSDTRPKIRGDRPTPKFSEEVTTDKSLKTHFPASDWEHQPVFLKGERVERVKGRNPLLSTEPDWYSKSLSTAVEVKNKDFVARLQSVNWKEIDMQLEQRIHSMPARTKNWIFFDIRKQPVGVIEQISSKLSSKWDGVFFMTDNGLSQLRPKR